jgi:hypothetical protein
VNYTLLGQNLHNTADGARKYFASSYGAKRFLCEEALSDDLPLRPTWQGDLGGYRLAIEVRETPFSQTLFEFVTLCSQRGLPIRLWVAVPDGAAAPNFNGELKQARQLGVGVVQITNGKGHEFHKPVPLSLFALRKTDMNQVPRALREAIKTAEDDFLGGNPAQACQGICQELEQITRRFAEQVHANGWWRQQQGTAAPTPAFFRTRPWADMLDRLDQCVDQNRTRTVCPEFTKTVISQARGYTNWRNALSHKPKNLVELQKRDARLRTMFEATRDLLLEWYEIAKPLKL